MRAILTGSEGKSHTFSHGWAISRHKVVAHMITKTLTVFSFSQTVYIYITLGPLFQPTVYFSLITATTEVKSHLLLFDCM